MKKLGLRNYQLIARGVNTHGTYNPDEILYIFEEQLYVHQIEEIISFLKWCHENGKGFGSGNYELVFAEWKSTLPSKKKKSGREMAEIAKKMVFPNTLIKREIPC